METSCAVLIKDGNRPKHVCCPGVRRVYIKGLKPRSEELITFTLSTPGNYHRHAQTQTHRGKKEERWRWEVLVTKVWISCDLCGSIWARDPRTPNRGTTPPRRRRSLARESGSWSRGQPWRWSSTTTRPVGGGVRSSSIVEWLMDLQPKNKV